MSREVHNGPTDDTQARGTPFSGDPQGGDGREPEPLDKLPLDAWHRARGGRMVPFAGYEMPVQYEGIIAEHLWTRENAGPVRRQPHGPAVRSTAAASMWRSKR